MGACDGACGVEVARERQRAEALAAVVAAFPGFRWCARDDAVSTGRVRALHALGSRLEALAPVRAFGSPVFAGCALLLLAGLNEPALLELDEVTPEEPSPSRHETYLRIVLSPLGRFAAVQELVVHGSPLETGDLAVVVEPQAGVTDRRLGHIVRAVWGELRRAHETLLDPAFLLSPAPADAPQGDYERAFGEPPTLWSFLFDASPPTAPSFRLVRAVPRGSPRTAVER